MKRLGLIGIGALTPILFACGSSDEGPSDDPSATDSVDETTDMTAEPPEEEPLACDPNGEIPCIEGIAEPCDDIDSGFPGDEYCRAVPDWSIGMQVHVGPDDYTDPDQLAQYLILPGDETNWAETVQFPNDVDVFTRGYRSYMRPGSHHFIMFGTNTGVEGITQNSGGAESAVGIGGRFLGGATKAIQNVDTQGEYPEDKGIGSAVPASSYVAMNLHFVNAHEEALIQEIWVNFIFLPEEEVTHYVKPITWYGGLFMNIPPGTHTVLSNEATACVAPADIRIGMMTAHAHANTHRVTTYMNQDTLLFEDYDWAEPTEWRYRRDIENPLPDRNLAQSGGYSGLLETAAGDSFLWECEIENKASVNLTFSNSVYNGEMCNVFGFYITEDRNAPNWGCAFF